MKITNAVRKLERLGLEVETNGVGEHWAIYKGYVVSFYRNGGSGEITCVNTKRVGEESDSQSDYFVESFHDNLTRAIRFVDRFDASDREQGIGRYKRLAAGSPAAG